MRRITRPTLLLPALVLATTLLGCSESPEPDPVIPDEETAIEMAEIAAARAGRLMAGRRPRAALKGDVWEVRFATPGGRTLGGTDDFTIRLRRDTGEPLTVTEHSNR